jgi:PAS domain S-box-containing protein
MSSPPVPSEHGSFWSVFERSQIPMALLDQDRRYVAVNDAATELYGYSREEIIGQLAGSGIKDEDPAIGKAGWDELVKTGSLYGERLVRGSSGTRLRVSFAAHATKVEERWLALWVVLSAHVDPGGEELIGTVGSAGEHDPPSEGSASFTPGSTSVTRRLTAREREIVQRVALGRSTPQIAVDLQLSPATVRSHVRNAMVKTGAHTRAQLVALVLGEGVAGA